TSEIDKPNFSNNDLNSLNQTISTNTANHNGLILNSSDSDNLGYLLKNIDILKEFIESNKNKSPNNEVSSLEDIVN
ncbi:hypothetical protein L0M92_15325, partial [Casaltella massiliensis]|nr:hypothetical protein [Casaltella massiliensis]